MKIYKYPIAVARSQFVEVPQVSRVLTAQIQRGALCVWIEVDPSTPLVWRCFDVFATGQPIAAADRTYIGTVQEDGLVWHVFERHGNHSPAAGGGETRDDK